MAGSSIGTLFRITTWGETHGEGLGVVVDGCPAGLPISKEDIQQYLNRRKPGQSKYTTPRKEDDQAEILSGVFEGKTTGTPISMAVYNKNQRARSEMFTGPDMRIILMMPNTESGITEAGEGLPAERPSAVWLPEQWLSSC